MYSLKIFFKEFFNEASKSSNQEVISTYVDEREGDKVVSFLGNN